MKAHSNAGSNAGQGNPAAPMRWDQRFARWCVGPLAHTPVSPNQVTTVSLIIGLLAGGGYALGGVWAYWGAALFVVAALLDHADGELARLTGRASRFGHYYDNVAGGLTHVALFCGMGIGLQDSQIHMLIPNQWALVVGITAGAAVAIIFTYRVNLEDQAGPPAVAQPSAFGFEIEDIMYLVAPITWLGWHGIFLSLAGIGAPLFLVWQLWHARRSAARR